MLALKKKDRLRRDLSRINLSSAPQKTTQQRKQASELSRGLFPCDYANHVQYCDVLKKSSVPISLIRSEELAVYCLITGFVVH